MVPQEELLPFIEGGGSPVKIAKMLVSRCWPSKMSSKYLLSESSPAYPRIFPGFLGAFQIRKLPVDSPNS